jgi:hypothetical protein
MVHFSFTYSKIASVQKVLLDMMLLTYLSAPLYAFMFCTHSVSMKILIVAIAMHGNLLKFSPLNIKLYVIHEVNKSPFNILCN